MVRQKIRVFIRTRPTTKPSNHIKFSPKKSTVEVRVPPSKKKSSTTTSNNNKKTSVFKFNGILHNSSQDEVFSVSTVDMLDSIVNGFNGTVLCYGQTGSGKTYTMSGPPDQSANFSYRGIIPRSVEYLFQKIRGDPEISYKVFVSYLEIYNDKLYDLLNSSSGKENELKIIELSKDNIFVKGLRKVPVKDEEEALSCMFVGDTQRSMDVMNKDSTRSHCIFTVYLESKNRTESTGDVTYSKLNLVDLAGSERIKKTKSTGQTLHEAKFINRSLLFLEQVVIALNTPNRDHVPYRQTALTHLLTDSIGGNAKTIMIANVYGEDHYIDETLSTLKFAKVMMKVTNTVVANMRKNPKTLLKEYEKKVVDLKKELAMHDKLKGVKDAVYDDYTEDQKLYLRKKLMNYVNGETEMMEIKNLRQVKESFEQFKVIILNLKNDIKSLEENGVERKMVVNVESANNNNSTKAKENSGNSGKKNKKNEEQVHVGKKRVGERTNDTIAFGMGIPADNLIGKSLKIKDQKSPLKSMKSMYEETEESNKEKMGRNDAFEKFKLEGGKEFLDGLNENTKNFNEKKKMFKDLGMKMNEAKKKIDEIKGKIKEKKMLSNDQSVVDIEIQQLQKRLKENKNTYNTLSEKRDELRNELNYVSNVIESLKKRMISKFEEYFNEGFEEIVENSSRSIKTNEMNSLDDKLDDGELFEILEERRLKENDPKSYMYYKAFRKSKIQTKRNKFK